MDLRMHEEKEVFANDVIHIIRELCKTTFNVHSNEQLENLFGINYVAMEEVIKRFISALPDNFFLQPQGRKFEELKTICARDFIFFQVQERWGDPDYENNLINFIRLFSKDMQNRI